jgi:histidinol-phosphate aminotransferase
MGLLRHRAAAVPGHQLQLLPGLRQLYGIATRAVPLAEDFSLRVDDLQAGPNGGIFANPNAPTGMPRAGRDPPPAAGQPDSVVVVDEAYVDFGAESAVGLIAEFQLLVVHTLSKSRALAGLRVGYAMGQADLIEALTRVKDSFNSYPLDRLAIAGAVAAIEDEAWFEATCQKVVATRAHGGRPAGPWLPGAALGRQFRFAQRPGGEGAALAAGLREHKVLVRHFRAPERIAPFLRISVGTEAQTDALLAALDAILA